MSPLVPFAGEDFRRRPGHVDAVVALAPFQLQIAARQMGKNFPLRLSGQHASNANSARAGAASQRFAFNSAFAQLVFGAASFLSPLVYVYLVTRLGTGARPSGGLLGLLAARMASFAARRSSIVRPCS